jgi:glycine cleavage system H protein
LSGEPGTVNSDPLGDGWFFRIRVSDPGEFDGLMSEAEYKEYVEGLS